jgi:hypothetical protein
MNDIEVGEIMIDDERERGDEVPYIPTLEPTVEPQDKLFTALAKAQAEIGGAHKDSTNPFFNSSYADLASVWDAVRGPLSKNGLSIVQMPTLVKSEDGKGVRARVQTILAHSSGQTISSVLDMPCAKVDSHAVGSAITYARRYALQAFCGVAPVDDDANAAVEVKAPKKT